MDFTQPERRRASESIVPMINVVFLLLIFFLMTSQIAPPEPFEVTTPLAEDGADTQAELVLYIDQTGKLHFDGAEGEAALVKLGSLASGSETPLIRADANLEAKVLASVLKDLGQAGFAGVELAVMPQ